MEEINGTTKRNIILHLKDNPDSGQREIAEEIGRSKRTVKDNLDEMNDMGLVTKHKVNIETSWKWGYRLIDDNIKIKRLWTNFLPDISIIFASLISSMLIYILLDKPWVIIGSVIPMSLFLFLTIYRVDKVGENKKVMVKEGG